METTNNYRELDAAYTFWNKTLFHNSLPEVMFTFDNRSNHSHVINIKPQQWLNRDKFEEMHHELTVSSKRVSELVLEYNKKHPAQWKELLDTWLHLEMISTMNRLKLGIDKGEIRNTFTNKSCATFFL